MDQAQPAAEAIAIFGDRIVAVGSNQEIRPLAGPDTRIIDAGQWSVLPGFNDAHVHFLAGGHSLSNVDLRGATSPVDLARRLAEYASQVPRDRWILGGDWDHEKWLDLGATASRRPALLPTRSTIDSVSRNHPVLITRL